MPIKPIDMQVMLPNIRKAARPENVKEAAKELASQQQQIHENKELEHQRNRVSKSEKKDQNEIKNDQERSKDKNKSKSKKKKEEEEEEEELKKKMMAGHGSKFDIKV